MPSPKLLRRAAPMAAALALAACADGAPLSPRAPSTPVPITVRTVECVASVRSPSVTCGGPVGAGRADIHVGGQGQYVQLSSFNAAYDAPSGTFSFDADVQNLIPQPMATPDGATPSPTGVRVFFSVAPHATGGSVGPADSLVSGYDGIATFNAANQRYYEYAGKALGGDGILSTNETSAPRPWTIHVPATVTGFAFQVLVSTEVPHPTGYLDVTPAADSLVAGGTAGLAATARTAVGDVVPGQTVTWGTSDPAVATVAGDGTVTAVAPGTVTITGTSGARSGTATLAVCPALAVGGVYPLSAAGLCLAGGASGAEYTVIGQNLDAGAASAFSLTGSGIVPVSGPPTPNRIAQPGLLRVPAGPRPDEAFHARLMQASHDLPSRLGLRPVPSRRTFGSHASVVGGVPSVGAVMSLNVGQGFCSPTDVRAATVRAVGTHVIVVEDNTNPSGGFTTAQYDSIAAAFDTLAYPAVAGNFGTPSDIDGNGRVIALFTASVNDLTPSGSSSYVGGFFYSRDLYSSASCAGSNQGEMFYMLAPDPTGAHGNVRTAGFVDSVTVGTLGHELQHLINASRRTYGAGGPYPLEQVWLDEGLSHVAEEEVYYASSLHGPGENLGLAQLTANGTQEDRFFTFAEANFGRLREWLLQPHLAGPFEDADELAIRGSTWAFLRYAADRKGGLESDLWSGLAFSPDTGLTNLANRLGTDPRPWFRDFATAMYADDAGIGAAAPYTQPSWNFRSIYGALSYDGAPAGYPLAPIYPANGVSVSRTLSPGGGAAYLRMRVVAGAFAGVSGTAPTSLLAVTVVRTK